MTPEILDFQESLDYRLTGTPDAVKDILRSVASDSGNYRLEEAIDSDVGSCLIVRVRSQNREGPIGKMFVWPLPGDRALLRIPSGRGSRSPESSWETDPSGVYFSEFLRGALVEFKRLEVIAGRSRFDSTTALETAIAQLASADDSAAFAAIGFDSFALVVPPRLKAADFS